MILGTWNLEVYPSTDAAKGRAMNMVLANHPADIWFLTEIHANWRMDGFQIVWSPSRDGAPPHRRKSALASNWPMETIPPRNNPVEGRLCMARITDPESGETIIAASSTLPWRGSAPKWRRILGQELPYADIYKHVVNFTVDRICAERRPDEAVVWGGDFNQGFYERDYVGTRQGRALLLEAFESLSLQVPTMEMTALIDAHPAIDHIAFPADWSMGSEPRVIRPEHNGRFLSDHALYLLPAESSFISSSLNPAIETFDTAFGMEEKNP